jgi:hypothetical protein
MALSRMTESGRWSSSISGPAVRIVGRRSLAATLLGARLRSLCAGGTLKPCAAGASKENSARALIAQPKLRVAEVPLRNKTNFIRTGF